MSAADRERADGADDDGGADAFDAPTVLERSPPGYGDVQATDRDARGPGDPETGVGPQAEDHDVRIQAAARRVDAGPDVGAAGSPASDDDGPSDTTWSIGPYPVLGRLGRGGMGEVFLSQDAAGAEVAVKVLTVPLDDEVARRRFEREGDVLTLLGSLGHPAIVSVVGRGVDDATGRPYLAMRRVVGRDLDAVLADLPEQRLTIAEAAWVLERAAQALEAAHGHGVLHRDLKPANLLVTAGGDVLLTDFGIALSEDVSLRLTRDEVLGTPAYLAPEVLLGEPWTAAADLYALGALAYRVVAGRPLFTSQDATEVLCDQITRETPRLADARPEAPAWLTELTARLLARDPHARPTAADVRAALAPHLPPPAAVERLASAAARGPGVGGGPGPAGPAPRAFVEGQVFHHYRIDGELGRGAMGVVYRAFHLGLKRPVALKVLLSGALASDVERRRFLREAQAASALAHPNVVSVLDAGEHDGAFYLTMELVQGEPLARLVKQGHERRALLHLFCGLCDGVHHAHTRGVIHRDLKPENVLVTPDGTPRILDFGVAKALDRDEEQAGDPTREGNLLGTLRYMPPEQAAGKVADVDVRSDVYALGSILYELVAGLLPFRGSARELIHQVLLSEPPPPSQRAPDVPWELDAICLKALEKERDARYQSALELKQDVERFLHDQPVLARRATLAYRARKWARRNRGAVAAGAGVGAVVLALAAGWTWSVVTARRAHAARVVDACAAGWRHLEAGAWAEAEAAFRLAGELLRPEDNLHLPAEVAALAPADALADLPAAERGRPPLGSALLRGWAAFARQRGERAALERLLDEGGAALARGDLAQAGEAAVVAARRAPGAPEVAALAAGVGEAHLAAARRELEAARAAGEDLAARRAALERARVALAEAQRADPASEEVRAALARVLVEQGQAAELEQARGLRARQREQGRARSAEGRRLLEAGDLDGARRAFEQALGFDGTDDAAQEGLVEVYHRAQELRRREAEAARRAHADELVARALGDHERARALYARGQPPGEVREAYLAALEALRQALFLDPAHAEAAGQLQGVARELSAVLVDQGNPDLAQFVLRLGGVDTTEVVRVELPRDPHLAVVEADQVNVRAAFQGGIQFAPTEAFDKLRAWVRSQSDRYRFVIEVRTEITPRGAQTLLHATGLRIRMEDRVAGTVSPPVDVRFEGGPYLRPVVVTPQGHRVVRAFHHAQGLDAQRHVRQVEGIVQGMLQRAKR